MNSHLVWNVDRVLLHIYGPFSLRWYSLCFVAGILLGNYMFLTMVKREGQSIRLTETLLYYIVIGTVVGARLGHCLFYAPLEYLQEPWRIFQIWEGGLASHGGYLGVIIAMYLFSKKFKAMSFPWVADRLSMCSILAGACIRLGNFFNSEIIGKVSDVPWAMIFRQVDEQPRHPSQLYEAFGYLSISLFLYFLYRKTNLSKQPGRLFGWSLGIAFAFRFFVEMFKENQEVFENSLLFNMGQLLSLPFVLIGLALGMGWLQKWTRVFQKAQ
ncbi:MAG: prolipoprotein diacylglyceryl transferase [Oligoflexales bacterium]|nr:prolipoprotein diacylglyceryl transferase [Oligoflexales bacterium]